jgi:hypothetical protein
VPKFEAIAVQVVGQDGQLLRLVGGVDRQLVGALSRRTE